MGNVQQWFIDHRVGRFYSASISGNHVAEAGANPISHLAFTLAKTAPLAISATLIDKTDPLLGAAAGIWRALNAVRMYAPRRYGNI